MLQRNCTIANEPPAIKTAGQLPHSPFQPAIDWEERKAPKCLPVAAIRGALLSGPSQLDFILAGGARVRAKFDEDCPALDFYGSFYLQPEDIRLERLTASNSTTRCPYKGIASYWSGLLSDGSVRPDIAWSYRDPIAEMPKIKGLIAFYPQAVDRIHLDGEPVA